MEATLKVADANPVQSAPALSVVDPENPPQTDVTFSSSDGLSITIPAAEVLSDKDAMDTTVDAFEKWKNRQAQISARFGAPKCYEAKGPHREILEKYLSSIHKFAPKHAEYVQRVADMEKNEANPGQIHEAKLLLRGSTERIKKAVNQVIETLRRYYMEVQGPESRNDPSKPAPMERIMDLRKRLEKYKPEQWTAEEYAQAQVCAKILHQFEAHGLPLMREVVEFIQTKRLSLPAAAGQIDKSAQKVEPARILDKAEIAATYPNEEVIVPEKAVPTEQVVDKVIKSRKEKAAAKFA